MHTIEELRQIHAAVEQARKKKLTPPREEPPDPKPLDAHPEVYDPDEAD